MPDPEKAAILVVGFGRAAGRQVRLWRQHIDGIESAPSVASVLVIDDMTRLTRGVLTRMMRGEVSEERQETIYLVTEDGEAWRDLAQIDETSDADAAYVVRFDGRGQVCFRHVGAVTDAAASALLAADCGLSVDSTTAELPSDWSTPQQFAADRRPHLALGDEPIAFAFPSNSATLLLRRDRQWGDSAHPVA